jgi:hypothetical protein
VTPGTPDDEEDDRLATARSPLAPFSVPMVLMGRNPLSPSSRTGQRMGPHSEGMKPRQRHSRERVLDDGRMAKKLHRGHPLSRSRECVLDAIEWPARPLEHVGDVRRKSTQVLVRGQVAPRDREVAGRWQVAGGNGTLAQQWCQQPSLINKHRSSNIESNGKDP